MYKRALVVDDEQAICDLIEKVLLSAGLEALTLTRSAEAPGLLEEGKFDVVFLDLHMPFPDGIDLARQMRRTESNRVTAYYPDQCGLSSSTRCWPCLLSPSPGSSGTGISSTAI